MYTPISCEFFDQLQVAIQRKIPSTVVYLEEDVKKTKKDIVSSMEVVEGIEYMILKNNQRIRLDFVVTFNGKKYKEE